MAVQSFRELIVWQKAMTLAEIVYRDTTRFPKEETYGLVSQMRRGAVSIASNIAEGQARATRSEFLQFLGIARGSLAELETQAILAQRLKFLKDDNEQQLFQALDEVGRLLTALVKSLKPSG